MHKKRICHTTKRVDSAHAAETDEPMIIVTLLVFLLVEFLCIFMIRNSFIV